MKIALMTNNYKPFTGGVPISIERLAEGLKQRGHEVTIFAPTYKDQKEEENVFRYASCLQKFIGGIVLPNPFDPSIEREFKRQSFDVIHVHHPMLIGHTAVYLSRKYRIPLVFTYHTQYEQYLSYYTNGLLRMPKLMTLYLKNYMRHCDYILAPTKSIQRYLTQNCKIDQSRIGILPTGIGGNRFWAENNEVSEIRKKYHAESIPLLLTVSRMAEEKNVNFLLRSIAQMKKMYGKEFKVLMVGDGPDRAKLETLSKELNLAENIIFTGTIPNNEISPYYGAADAFIFASKTETQGIVIIEAFAGKTPVIAVKAPGVEDLVEDDANGYLVDENEDLFATKLYNYLKLISGSEKETLRLSQNAFLTSQLYREEAVALRAERYYNSVITDYRMRGLSYEAEISHFGG